MISSYWFLPGIVVFWSIVLTVIFRLEKRMVWPYGELEKSPYFGDPTGYGSRWISEAVQAGFSFLGWARDIKGPAYQVSYAMLISENRDTFAVIGVGTILKIPLRAIWLHTPAANGGSFYSTNQQSGVQIDLTRNWSNQLVPVLSFTMLLWKHREWIQAMGVVARFFTPGREYDEFRNLRHEHFRFMERAGLIRFCDPALVRFHFTLSGAARTAVWGYFLGMMRQISSGRFPRTA